MKVELRVEGMTCLSCARHVESALLDVPGVQQVRVDYATGRATVLVKDAVQERDLLDAVAGVGYRAAAEPPAGSTSRPAATMAAGSDADSDADFDLLVIGTGGAGTAAAIRAAEIGARVAVVEGAEVVGGTCVNIGCIPSKYLIEAAHHVYTARSVFPGIAACDPQLAWAEVIRRKREIVDRLRQEKYLDVLASYPEITLLHGRARLTAPGRVEVSGREIRAARVVVATGTRPGMPPVPGLNEAGALDSTSVMELESLPGSMVVIGGGSIGLELGQAFARFGVKVVVLEVADRILIGEDPEISDVLADSLRAEGIEVHTGVQVTRVERDSQGFVVHMRDGSIAGQLRAEQLLVATGRIPNTEDLGLEAVGVETDVRGFIRVDEYMRTTSPRIFAGGDVTGGPGYVYVAALGGGIAAQAALEDRATEGAIAMDLSAVPRVVFTDPQVAAVGMSEGEAKAAGISAQVTTLPVSAMPRAVVSHRDRGVIKLVSEIGTDRLLGAHIVAPNAGDLIGEAVLAVRFGLTTRDVVSTLHAYLTWGEGLKLAAQTFTKDVAKLSCCA